MVESVKQYDIIVIGSGIAGHALAKRASLMNKVLIIEGGDTSEKKENLDLTLNDEYGHFSNNHWSRHWVRAYGGTSRRWNAWLATLDKRDFEGSTILPKWPIHQSDLLKYYKEAALFLGRSEAIATDYPIALPGDVISYKPFSNGIPLRFTEIEQHPNITVWVNKTVIRLDSHTRKTISGIWIHDKANGETLLEISPRQQIVLACGGLGNAQILLQPTATSEIPVGNESGLVGKCLMEHPHAKCADLYVSMDLAGKITQNFGEYTPAYIVSEKIYYDESLLACTIAIENIDTTRDCVSDMQQYFEDKFNKKLVKAIGYARSEQEPQKINSVQILGEKNWAGLYRLRAQCAFSTRDLWSIDKTTRTFAEHLNKHQLGVAKIDNESIYRKARGGGHTMGTTRMGFSENDSVCDANCKVHSYNNLYLAGSSVFTTGGAAQPTLTIAALAMRLSDHLTKTFP
jgi:choline dehydrogenase-like flavoprotein